jgi:uncharacterized protein YbbC (DUF1343 family)
MKTHFFLSMFLLFAQLLVSDCKNSGANLRPDFSVEQKCESNEICRIQAQSHAGKDESKRSTNFCNQALIVQVDLGVDCFFKEGRVKELEGKRIGLITNHTGVNKEGITTQKLLERFLSALFCPEHGLDGSAYAWEKVEDKKEKNKIPIYSLHGKTKRPTAEMLEGLDVLIYDIQDVGIRAYTYATTLFYTMEEASKRGIQVIVLDRPNPINGLIVDGGMLEEKWRSYIGYINVPYCHGMTIGELAWFFNIEYQIGCKLEVIPMKGWKRSMSFRETGLMWIPTSPHIPEPDTPLFCASTGILGELGIVNIGVGYTLPFKVVGAPWIDADTFASKLNEQKLSGVRFSSFHYRPFYGIFKGKDCHGVLIQVTDFVSYHPLQVQYLLIGMLKSLYPRKVEEALRRLDTGKRDLFCKANGNGEIYRLLQNEKYVAWKMISYQKQEREQFKKRRNKYLLY